MSISNRRRGIYILFSLVMAFALWYYVNSTASVDLTLYDVPVEFLNAETALANKGFVLLDANDAKVDLVLTMSRDLVFRFKPEQLRLYANLVSVNSAGSQSIPYTIAYPPGIGSNRVFVKSPTVQTVLVRVGELFRKNDVEIRVNLVGSLADGHVAGRVTTLPSTLSIWGEQREVTRVSYAQVTLDIEDAASTINEQLPYEFYDEDDVLIENHSLHSATNNVQVTMPVISATEIPLTLEWIEAPGVRKSSFDYTLDVSAVTLAGDADQLAGISELILGEIALPEITDQQTFTFPIPVPEGLSNLSGVSEATLRIKNRDVTTAKRTVTSFGYENFNADGQTVEVVTSSLDVVLRGARETLDSITDEAVTAVANLTDVANASGTYTVPAEIRIAGEPDVGLVEPCQLTVRIGAPDRRKEAGQ